MKKIYKYKKGAGGWNEHYQEVIGGKPTRYYLKMDGYWEWYEFKNGHRFPKRFDKIFTEGEFMLEII